MTHSEPVPQNVPDLFGLMKKGVHEVGFAIGGDGQQFIVTGKDAFFVRYKSYRIIIFINYFQFLFDL